MQQPFIVFGSPQVEQAEIDEVLASLHSGWLGTGPKVARFENEFAAYKGVAHTAAVNSCTAALHLSLLAADLHPGDEVITTPLTFCATVNAILHAGATPVLADVDPVTMNIDPEQVEARIMSRTRAILPVHFAGRPCEMDALMEIARRHDLQVIEDKMRLGVSQAQGGDIRRFRLFFVLCDQERGHGGGGEGGDGGGAA